MSTVKTARILLPSLARTVATASKQVTDPMMQCARFYLNITAASGTGGLTLQLRGYDKASGAAVVLDANSAIITTGLFAFEVMAFARTGAPAGVKASLGCLLPYTWDVNIAVGDASSYTYSLSVELMPG